MSSDIANMVVDKAQNRAKTSYSSLFDLFFLLFFNFQIEETIKKIGDEDLLDNFFFGGWGGVFPSNCMNKFINHAAMIEDKKGKYPFIIANTNSREKKGMHCWSILNIEPRNVFFSLILSV